MTALPSREAIAAAEPLTFPDRKSKLMSAETIHLFYHGVEFTFGISNEARIHELEQAVDTILKRDGWSGAAPQVTHTAPLGSGKPAAPRLPPAYDGDGNAMCPVHHKPLQEGKFGLFCSAKAKGDEAANAKGYCNIRFEE